ncbi:MAG: glycosyltransferase [Desulfonatronovibrio sp.]
MSKTRILFFVERNLHLPYLEPVHDYFRLNHPDVSLAFSAPPFRAPTRELPGCGLEPGTIQRLAGKSRFVSSPAEFAPQATLVADINAAAYLRGCGRIINVGHGMISKGCFYTSRPIIRRENLADLVCVPGPIHAQRLESNVFIPVETTGFIKSDRLFGPQSVDRDGFCLKHGIDPGKKIILFAPTYNPELSSIPVVQEKIFELAKDTFHLLVKLHGMTDQGWADFYRDECLARPGCTFIQDQDLTPCLKAADLLVSDVSSAFVEFMLLDRPIVLVDNPARKDFIHYDPEDIEYRVRDACVVVKDFNALKQAVAAELENPDRLSCRRRAYARDLCFGRDGRAVARTAQAILQNLHTPFPKKFSILVFWDHAPGKKELLWFWENLSGSASNFDLEVIMAGPKPELPTLTRLAAKWIECKNPDARILGRAVKAASHGYIAFVRPDAVLIPGWLKFLYSHLRWNSRAGLVQATTPNNGYKAIMDKFFPEYFDASYSEVSFMFNRYLIGSSLQTGAFDPVCFMLSLKTFRKAWKDPASEKSIESGIRELGYNIRNQGKTILRALDVLAYSCGTGRPGPVSELNQDEVNQNEGTDSPVASIIIPVFNNLDFTAKCLEKIIEHGSRHSFEIIVVDNGSQDGTKAFLRELSGKKVIRSVINQRNLGFARACNQGAKKARGKYLVFLNNDTEVTRGWLDALIDCARQDSKRAAIGAKLLYPDNTVQHAGVVFTAEKTIYHIYNGFHKDHPAVNKPRVFQAVSAACMLVAKDIFIEAGMFDERFINGFEDVDLCLKLRQKGYENYYCPQAVVYHYESKTPGRFEFNRDNERLLRELWSKKVERDETRFYALDSIRLEVLEDSDKKKTCLMHDQNHNPFWKKAREYASNQKISRAIDMYASALQFNPYNPDNLVMMEELACLLYRAGRFDDARKCLNDLLERTEMDLGAIDAELIRNKLNQIDVSRDKQKSMREKVSGR